MVTEFTVMWFWNTTTIFTSTDLSMFAGKKPTNPLKLFSRLTALYKLTSATTSSVILSLP